MKVYRTDRGGIEVLRLSGIVGKDDAGLLLNSLRGSEECARGCFVLDFENVEHVDYRIFRLLEDLCSEGAKVFLSGLSDYLLDILAFVSCDRCLPVYPDWKKALHHIVAERGKLDVSFSS